MIRVAIVDDEPLARDTTRLVLTGAAGDVEVVASCSGVDAPEVLRRTAPDLVFLDVVLTGGATVRLSRSRRAEAPDRLAAGRRRLAAAALTSCPRRRTVRAGGPKARFVIPLTMIRIMTALAWPAYGDPPAKAKAKAPGVRTVAISVYDQGAIASYGHVAAGSSVYAKARYNLACALPRSGNQKAALAAVSQAFAAGIDRGMALSDPDLASIRDQLASAK